LFHAFEDEVDAESLPLLHAAQCRRNIILFANAFPCPFNRELVVAGVGFDPVLVIIGALAQNFLAHHRNTEDLANEVNHLFGPGQPAEVAVDDNAVEAVIYKNEQAAKHFVKVSIGRLPLFSSRQQDHRTDDRWFQNFKYLWLSLGIIAALMAFTWGGVLFIQAE
jgi:hypothetical protein